MSGNAQSRQEQRQESHRQRGGCVSQSIIVTGSLSQLMLASASFSKEIRLEKGVWNLWKDFNDRFEYYRYQGHMHKAVCIRRTDTGEALNIDLIVEINEENRSQSKWHVRVRKAEWRPPSPAAVRMSKHTWHPAAAFKAVHIFASKFGKWDAIWNNCFDFVNDLVGSMVQEERRQECECNPILDFEEFTIFAEKMGIEVCYMKKEELAKLSDDTPRAEGGRDSGVDTEGEEQAVSMEYKATVDQNNVERSPTLDVQEHSSPV